MPGVSTLALSGWGQSHDVLQALAPEAATLDYAHLTTVAQALKAISEQGKDKELVIGWSLGGQLAVRAIASGLLKPKKLVLIATPFQFVAAGDDKLGMPPDLYRAFYDNYAENPEKTLIKAWASILKGDKHAIEIRKNLDGQDKTALLGKNWLIWLDILQSFSCNDLFMADFPPTLLIHGDNDAVVYPEQSLAFARAIPHAQHITLKDCGHAPHWHATEHLRQAITDFAHV